MRELLRPPPHRGPLIAAGGVALAVGIAVHVLGKDPLHPDWPGVVALLTSGGLLFWLGAQAPNEDGQPPAYQSVLLATGWPFLYGGMLALFTVAGVTALLSIALASALAAALAVWPALERNSAISLLGAAVAGGVALGTAWTWLFDTGWLRWIALLYAAGLVLFSLVLREPAPRHGEVLIDAAGLAVVFIGYVSYRDGANGLWEVVLLGAGLGLTAFGALDRSPGPGYLGVLNLIAFIAVAGRFWPVVLVAAGAIMLAAGLRPRRPLPPEPDPYRAGEAPLAARVDKP